MVLGPAKEGAKPRPISPLFVQGKEHDVLLLTIYSISMYVVDAWYLLLAKAPVGPNGWRCICTHMWREDGLPMPGEWSWSRHPPAVGEESSKATAKALRQLLAAHRKNATWEGIGLVARPSPGPLLPEAKRVSKTGPPPTS